MQKKQNSNLNKYCYISIERVICTIDAYAG